MEIEGTILTFHARPQEIAASLRPDNLQGMTTGVLDGVVLTTIRGQRLRSVIASVDDYLMNLGVAEELCTFVSY